MNKLIQKAINYFGTQEELAKAINVRQSAISSMLHERYRVTAENAVAIDKATRGVVSKKQLRPDLFGDSSD